MIRRALSVALLPAVSIALSLVAGELAVRLLRPQPRLVITPGGLYEADPPGRYRLMPGYRGRILNRAEYENQIRINERGLRGPELQPAADGRLRILAIGDSFVFGVGVEDSETFVAQAAERLTRRGRPAEGLNAGIPAFGVPDAVSWLQRHGVDLEPDVVVLAVFLGNDLIDASPEREQILIVDGLLAPERSPRGLKAWLHRRSHLYVAIKHFGEQPFLRPVRSRLGLGEPWTERILREEFALYEVNAQQRLVAAIEATDDALASLAADATTSGFRLVAMLIPSEVQVDSKRWRTALKALDLDPAAHDPSIQGRLFSDLLARHGIPVIDLAPVIAERLAAGAKLYYRLDRHWTPAGHALAADMLIRFLDEERSAG